MNHPLHNRYPVIEFSYVYAITANVDGEYWDLRLREIPETKEWVKRNIWTTDEETLMVEVSTNNKYAIVTFPDGKQRSLPLYTKDEAIYRTNDYKTKAINDRIEKRKRVILLHKVLEKLGIRFEIDFCRYKEDSDYMKVFIDDEEVFSGATEDLIKPKRKET